MADEVGTHIRFIEAPPKPKTRVWRVINRHDEIPVGFVAWFGRWRKYAFYPKPETVFEQVCLREIAGFCERHTRAHTLARKAR